MHSFRDWYRSWVNRPPEERWHDDPVVQIFLLSSVALYLFLLYIVIVQAEIRGALQ